MFLKKMRNILRQTWKPYVATIFLAVAISCLFRASVNNPVEVFVGIIAMGSLTFALLMVVFIVKFIRINRGRASAGIEKIKIMQVELNPATVFMDLVFLIFASWKVGEAMVKIPKLIDNNITPSQIIFVFSALTLTMAAILYSFMKALDKIKEYKGVNASNLTADTNMRGLSTCQLFWNSFWDFFIALVILVVSPALLGAVFGLIAGP